MTQAVVIKDNSRRITGWTLIVFGMLPGGFGVASVAFAWMPVLFGGLLALVGAVMVGRGIRQFWRSHLFGVSTLTVPGGASLRLGEVRVARFHRKGGQARARTRRCSPPSWSVKKASPTGRGPRTTP